MIRVDVDPGNVLARQFTALETKQLPFAAMQAVNRTAWEVRQAWMRQAQRVFDRPTQMTLRAVVYERATKRLPVAAIAVRDRAANGTPPAKYLFAQVQGGDRRPQRFERSLQYNNALPAGMRAIPSNYARLNQYGNLPRSEIKALVDGIKMQGPRLKPGRRKKDAPKPKNATGRSRYFALQKPNGKLKPGVYRRMSRDGAPRKILHFVASVQYQQSYNIFDYAEREYARNFPFFFQRELEKAVENAVARGWT